MSAVYSGNFSGLSRRTTEIHGKGGINVFDLAIHLFEFLDVVCQGFEQAFAVLGSEEDAGFDTGLGDARHHLDEIQHKLALRVGNDSEVGVNAFGNLFAEFNIEVGGIGLVFFHNRFSLETKLSNYCAHFCGQFFSFLSSFLCKIFS